MDKEIETLRSVQFSDPVVPVKWIQFWILGMKPERESVKFYILLEKIKKLKKNKNKRGKRKAIWEGLNNNKADNLSEDQVNSSSILDVETWE